MSTTSIYRTRRRTAANTSHLITRALKSVHRIDWWIVLIVATFVTGVAFAPSYLEQQQPPNTNPRTGSVLVSSGYPTLYKVCDGSSLVNTSASRGATPPGADRELARVPLTVLGRPIPQDPLILRVPVERRAPSLLCRVGPDPEVVGGSSRNLAALTKRGDTVSAEPPKGGRPRQKGTP